MATYLPSILHNICTTLYSTLIQPTENLGLNICNVKDDLLNHLHDDQPHVLVELVHLLHEDGLVDV